MEQGYNDNMKRKKEKRFFFRMGI